MSEDSALEQYLIQAKNAKGRAAAILVEQAISNSYVFHFAELLEHENIIALAANAETKPWSDLLQIFAYGTYGDYVTNAGALPPLDESQKLKLKQLTIITLANQNKVIPYATLLQELDFKDTRSVEDCIIEGMYSGLFKGKLDQKKQEFQVQETAGRDCKPGKLQEMIAVLQAWVQAAENTSGQIRDKIKHAENCQEAELGRVKDFQNRVDEMKKTLQSVQGDLEGTQLSGHSESMEMDDVSRPKSRPKTKHPSGASNPRH
ncbi:hypothetical protein GUITHDRAFT_115147 [Guillardia theta CCMP2712]|uniref:PCI domain-containing protein n=1 Tax=Guillardia theta (strain CCMP2712) TaxID=905079 RepID=L1IRD6_GUITC|nr:hypothetical protein GUITHDRAFT_115147 [Guillardia theta CCMP2712]EKX38821.1 hypothetical protein GUITHDRAFT_115147 [Guillardia theta CCMP2712]|eukprot:XP_005825801.1 hypothetical protein GUITHDRAFT_115147 [Guillardia theta CCMP2712]